MQSLRPSRAWYVCVVLTAAFSATMFASMFASVAFAAGADRGREFSGYYDLSGVKEQGDMVQLTLHLKLFNHTAADAKSVIVTLTDAMPAMTFRGNFQTVKVWKSQQFIELSQEFTVPKSEFEAWTHAPIQPELTILFQDSTGKSLQKGAQLSRRLMVRQPEME